jgi:hypothetical protein
MPLQASMKYNRRQQHRKNGKKAAGRQKILNGNNKFFTISNYFKYK